MMMKKEEEGTLTTSADLAQQSCTDEVMDKLVQELRGLYAAGKLAKWRIDRLEHIPGWTWGDAKPPRTYDRCVIGFSSYGSRVFAWLADAVDADAGELADETQEDGLSEAATRRAVRRLRKRAKELGYRRVELRNYNRTPFTVVSRSGLTRVAA
jgi:hypothetical protein